MIRSLAKLYLERPARYNNFFAVLKQRAGLGMRYYANDLISLGQGATSNPNLISNPNVNPKLKDFPTLNRFEIHVPRRSLLAGRRREQNWLLHDA